MSGAAGAQLRRVAGAVRAEVEVLPHHHHSGPEDGGQEVGAEGGRRERGELLVEGQQHEFVRTELADQPDLLLRRGEETWHARRVDHGERVPVERHDGAGQAELGRQADGAADHRAVPGVDAVKGAQGERSRARFERGDIGDDLHQSLTRSFRALPSSAGP